MDKDLFDKEEVRYLGWKQPFASLMLYGKIETRTWPTKYRGLVLITASKQPYHMEQYADISGEQYQNIWDVLGNPEDVILGHAIAVGRLVDCRKMLPEDAAKCFVKYYPDLYCHVYEDVRAIEPFEMKGAQGWRKLTNEVLSKIKYIDGTI